MDYRPRQSEVTIGQYAEEYNIVYEGKPVILHEHIGKGNSRDPRATIRIAFHYDEKNHKAVIGFIGQHQSSKNT